MSPASPPFVALARPYVDFLLAHRGGTGIASAMPHPIRESRADLPRGCRLFISDWAADFSIAPGCSLLAGVARIDTGLTFGPAEIRTDGLPQEIIGSCVVIERSSRTVDMRTDFLGLVPLFHAHFGDTALCSNRIHLIALAARASGHKLDLDYRYVASGIFVDSIWCTQVGTRFLPIEGVRMVRPGETVRFKARGMRVLPAPPIERRILEPDEYRQLIRNGAEEVAANISAAIDAASPAPLRADLTGGRDSRMILAGIVALGRMKEVRFGTTDVGDAADVDVASGLADYFAGSFSTEPARYATEPIPPDDVLHLHRSLFFGLYHDMRLPLSRPVAPAWPPSIGVGGGCGELYRDFWQKVIGDGIDFSMTSGLGRAVIRYFRDYAPWKLFPPHLKKDAPPLLAQSIKSLDGRTLGEKLDLHYLSFRNRLHFGLSGTMSSMFGAATFFPLASPSLLAAARGLPPEEKAMGRVVFDLTRELCPILPYLPYSADPWPDMTTSRYHSPSPHDGATPTLRPGRGAWETANAARRAQPGTHRSTSKGAVLDRITETLPAMIDVVREGAPEAGALIREDIMKKVVWLRARESKFQRFWYSRIAAMMDVLMI